ncbi:hypothetical protein Hamer_G005975, partial [Homarus americanus]
LSSKTNHLPLPPASHKNLDWPAHHRQADNDLHAHIPAKKPHLTEVDMERRLEYACFWEDVYCNEKTFGKDRGLLPELGADTTNNVKLDMWLEPGEVAESVLVYSDGFTQA